jgi:hypothetical protein
MEPFGVNATLMATAVATLLAVRAQRTKSLTEGGSIALPAFCVGFSSVWTGLLYVDDSTFGIQHFGLLPNWDECH